MRPAPPALTGRAITFVLLVSLGWFAVGSARRLILDGEGRLSGFEIPIDNRHLVLLLVYELVAGLLLAGFLARRGWRLEHITHPFAWRDLGRGLGVWLLAILCSVTAVVLWSRAFPESGASAIATRFTGRLDGALIAAVACVNPVFEEMVLLGFIATAFWAEPDWQIVLLSTALRTMVHTYQGATALLFILPIGLIFARYYVRTRRLWPVVLAHGLQDALALSFIAGGSGRP